MRPSRWQVVASIHCREPTNSLLYDCSKKILLLSDLSADWYRSLIYFDTHTRGYLRQRFADLYYRGTVVRWKHHDCPLNHKVYSIVTHLPCG